MNDFAGLLGFVPMKTWTKLLDKGGFLQISFARQESTAIQTGGFGSYLLGMSRKTYEQAGTNTAGDTLDTGFLFLVTSVGILVFLTLRKLICRAFTMLIVDYKLTYPSCTATPLLINKCTGFAVCHLWNTKTQTFICVQ
ncbi:hypothetical protein SUGI_1086840 [Cryptomeria japonica]|nr:hypothetical protein SUGI_1086840 [Cryptomeria japonica]